MSLRVIVLRLSDALDVGDLGPGCETLIVTRPEELLRNSGVEVVHVVEIRSAHDLACRNILQTITRSHGPPLILVADLEAELARRLMMLPSGRCHLVVWRSELPNGLVNAVRSLASSDPRLRLERVLMGRAASAVVKTTVRIAFGKCPPASVAELSDLVGTSESTLRYHWSSSFPRARLYDVVRWGRLLLALRTWGTGGGANRQVHPRTLERNADYLLMGHSIPSARKTPTLVIRAVDAWLETYVMNEGMPKDIHIRHRGKMSQEGGA